MERIPASFVQVTFEVASEAFRVLGARGGLIDERTGECALHYQVLQLNTYKREPDIYNWRPDGFALSYWADKPKQCRYYLHKDTLAELCDDILQRTQCPRR